MVPTPPTAHAGEAQVEYHWLGKLGRWLELGRRKVVILVEGASAGGLRPLVSFLLEHEAPIVCFHCTELLAVPDGSLVVLTLHEAELNWLNLNRPIVANKRLRVVLWLEFPLHRLKSKAPDFFDWISHIVRCPKQPPQRVVRELAQAKEAQRPVAWRGRELDAAMDRVGAGVTRLAARGSFGQLVSAAESVGERIPVWTGVRDVWHLLRIELTMQEAGHAWWIVEQPGRVDARYASIDDEALSWEDATERLGPPSTVADRSTAACVAALLEADPRAVDSCARALSDGQSLDEVLARLRGERGSRPGPRHAAPDAGEGSIDHAPAPTFAALLQRHARALHGDRSSAWVAAADCARLAGHPDIARAFGERALVQAKSERGRHRAKLALAAAEREAGAYGEAHAHFFELVQARGSAPAHDPRLAVVLTEHAALLAHEEHHAAAADDLAQAIEIWEARPQRALEHAHREARGLHARCLVALGRGSEALGLELAQRPLEQPGPRATVARSVRVLRALRASHGTDLHPRGVDARTRIGEALGERNPPRARRFLQRALDDCEVIHGETPHRRTLRVVTCLAEVERRRGDLAASIALAARAGELEHAIASSPWAGLERLAEAPAHPPPPEALEPVERAQALLAALNAPEAGLGDRSDLRRLAHDVQALRMFLAREAPGLQWWFRQRGLDPEGAHALTQDVLLDFTQAARQRDAAAWSPQTLLRSLARARLDPASSRPEPPGASTDRADLATLLGRLGPHEHAVVTLRGVDGRSWGEIAGALGLGEAAVRSIYGRGIAQLREQWRRR